MASEDFLRVSFPTGFEKIKEASGTKNVSEIVHRFLNRGQREEEIDNEIAARGKEIRENKAEIERLRSTLQDIQTSGITGHGSRQMYKEIDQQDEMKCAIPFHS